MNLETIKTELEKNQLGFNLTLLQLSDEDENFLQIGGIFNETNKEMAVEICIKHFLRSVESFKMSTQYNNETTEEMCVAEILNLIESYKIKLQ